MFLLDEMRMRKPLNSMMATTETHYTLGIMTTIEAAFVVDVIMHFLLEDIHSVGILCTFVRSYCVCF